VVGPDFTQLHQLFGGQYETMFEEVDRLSEHMRYLNIKPVSTLTRVTEVTLIDQVSNSAQAIDDKDMIGQLLSDNQKFISILTDISKEAESQNQYATANLVHDLMESHGKFVWQLRSHTQ
jgi:starvation-inducible DNA-binding protein